MKNSNAIIGYKEFMQLKAGDIIEVNIEGIITEAKVIRPTFWNSDADEPDYEVETTNGYYDQYSVICKKRR